MCATMMTAQVNQPCPIEVKPDQQQEDFLKYMQSYTARHFRFLKDLCLIISA